MQLSISDLLPYLDCSYRGVTRLREQRWTLPTDAMRLGTAVHTYCQQLLTTKKPNHDRSWLARDIAEAAEPLITAADLALAPPPFEVLDVELPLSYPLSAAHELVGRLDAVARHNGQLYSVQWKTLGKGQNLGNFLEKVRMSPHEISYRTMLRTRGEAVSGTLLGVFRTSLSKAQAADNVPIFEIFPLESTAAEDDAAFEDITSAAKDLLIGATNVSLAEPRHSRRNWAACFSIFGACPLVQHCHFGSDVASCLPAPLENRYTDLSATGPDGT